MRVQVSSNVLEVETVDEMVCKFDWAVLREERTVERVLLIERRVASSEWRAASRPWAASSREGIGGGEAGWIDGLRGLEGLAGEWGSAELGEAKRSLVFSDGEEGDGGESGGILGHDRTLLVNKSS